MKDFVLKEKDHPDCVKEVKKVEEVPSDDYVFCAVNTLTPPDSPLFLEGFLLPFYSLLI